eukprot:12712969-Ditylum_brightwellii.AAC.1
MVTGYGPTKKGITSTTEAPIYGIGQGPTEVPPNWTLVANACQKVYTKNSKGCQIQDATGTTVQQAPGKIFVDDKNLMHNGEKTYANAQKLMDYVTHDISLWD